MDEIMGQYRTTCPECGGDLTVTSFRASCSIPLCDDGFSALDAKYMDTEDEWVVCGRDGCGFEAPLSDLREDTEPLWWFTVVGMDRSHARIDDGLRSASWVEPVEATTPQYAAALAIKARTNGGEDESGQEVLAVFEGKLADRAGDGQ